MIQCEVGHAGVGETHRKFGPLPFVERGFFSGGSGEVKVDAFADERGDGFFSPS